nr:EAL domain-containing protein [uncultured Enterobacter sp.]
MYSFIARQPVFDKSMSTVAYELLFRDGMTNRFPDVSSEYATKQIISDLFLSTSLPKLVGNNSCYINFPPEMIVQGYADTLPHDKVVIEILETAKPNDELYDAVRRLHGWGFKIALDDFTLENGWERFMPFISIVKFDIRAYSFEEITQYIQQQKKYLGKVKLLAEKVETAEEFERYKAFGFDLYQGYFYSKPEIIKNKRLSPSKVLQFQLIQEVNAPNPDMFKIENYLKRDLTLSYTLMRYTKNVLFKNRGIVQAKNTTLRDTLLYLGINEVRRFVSISCLTNMADVTTDELYHMSLVRGMFCEHMARATGNDHLASDAFFCGLFSLLDTILGISLEDLFKQISLSENVMNALTKNDSVLYQFLYLAKRYEVQDWENAERVLTSFRLDQASVIIAMNRATAWADMITA